MRVYLYYTLIAPGPAHLPGHQAHVQALPHPTTPPATPPPSDCSCLQHSHTPKQERPGSVLILILILICMLTLTLTLIPTLKCYMREASFGLLLTLYNENGIAE